MINASVLRKLHMVTTVLCCVNLLTTETVRDNCYNDYTWITFRWFTFVFVSFIWKYFLFKTDSSESVSYQELQYKENLHYHQKCRTDMINAHSHTCITRCRITESIIITSTLWKKYAATAPYRKFSNVNTIKFFQMLIIQVACWRGKRVIENNLPDMFINSVLHKVLEIASDATNMLLNSWMFS